MKKHRLSAAGAVLALAVGSFAFAAPALAADVTIPDDYAYGVEGASYPDGWFTGNPQPEVAPVDDATGVTLTGRTQFLHGGIIPIASGADFTELVAGSAIDADGTTTFQYPLFFNSASDGNLGFSTLRPVPTGTPEAAGTWVSSQQVVIDGAVILTQGEHSWAEIVEAFDAAVELGAVPEVLAVGVIVVEGDTALVRSIAFGGDTYIFNVPVVTPDPETPTPPPATVPAPIVRNANFTG